MIQAKNKKPSLAPYRCLPIFLWDNPEVPQSMPSVVEFFHENFRQQPICIYSTNSEVASSRGSQIKEWVSRFEECGWTKEETNNIYFVNLTIDLGGPKEKLDYLFLEYIRSVKYFRKNGFTHFLWFSENSNLGAINKIKDKSKEFYIGQVTRMLVKREHKAGTFPPEACVYLAAWFFLDEENIINNEPRNFNYFV